jgi:GT2 family glycosyltransferase
MTIENMHPKSAIVDFPCTLVANSSNIFIIIPVHNRKEITLKCLRQLGKNEDFQKFQVVVVDDGSTDGTGQAIQKTYPQVHLLTGDGNLWWTGAIEMGMRYAFNQGADYFIWLNDDTLPEQGAISNLVKECKENQPCAIAAQCYDEGTETYGGHVLSGLKHRPVCAPSRQRIAVDSLCGNCTCIPRSAVTICGYPPSKIAPHYQGDVIYTWRLKKNGFNIFVTGRSRAYCSKNIGDGSWLNSELSTFTLWKKLGTPKSPFYIPSFFFFCLSMWGPLGLLVFSSPYLRLSIISILRLLIPKQLLLIKQEGSQKP